MASAWSTVPNSKLVEGVPKALKLAACVCTGISWRQKHRSAKDSSWPGSLEASSLYASDSNVSTAELSIPFGRLAIPVALVTSVLMGGSKL